MAKRLLYIAIHAWTSPIQVGSQAIATQFARNGWDVAYISAPITLLNWLRPHTREYEWRLREYRSGGNVSMGGRVWHYVPFACLAPKNRFLLRSSWLFENWQNFTVPNLLSIVQQRGFGTVDLLILDSIYQPFWLDCIDFNRSVLRFADYNAGFPGYGRGARRTEDKMIQRADCVVTASYAMQEKVCRRGARELMYLPNGVDYQRFNTDMPERPVEYAEMSGPIAVYVGVIAEWFDLSLIEACAQARPDVHFVLIGPNLACGQMRSIFLNIHFLGQRDSAEIPAYLRHADVGLIPFRSERLNALIEQINPLKLYEYLAAGLPVVATDWQELESLDSPAYLCQTTEDFIAALNKSLQLDDNAEKFRDFASTVDWSSRTSELMVWANKI